MKKKIVTLLLALVAIASGAQAQNKYRGHEYVDMGLSVYWATQNVGSYFWGQTDSNVYEYGFKSPYTRYNADDKTYKLLPEDDAAHVNWGGSWRMPSMGDLSVLISITTCSYDSAKKILTLTSKYTGNSITFNNVEDGDIIIMSNGISSSFYDYPYFVRFKNGNLEGYQGMDVYPLNTVKRANGYYPVRAVCSLQTVTISNVPEGWKVNGMEPTNGSVEVVAGERIVAVPANIPAGKKIKSIKLEPVE